MFSGSPLVAVWTVLTALILLPFGCAWEHSQSLSRDANASSTSVFVYNTVYGNITLAVTTVQDVGDMYLHIEGPAENSWVGFGIGTQMDASLMWVVYRSADGKGVTLCSRIATDNIEPSHEPNSGCSINDGDGITNGIVKENDKDMFVVNAYCKGINNRDLTRGRDIKLDAGADKVDFSNTQQPFIFALGPTDRKLQSDKKGADLRRHSMYGKFSLDLTKATVKTANDVDQKDLAMVGMWENHNAKITDGPERDSDWSGPVHSVLMCGTFVILFPLGVIFLRIVEEVKWHAWMQGSGSVLLVAGVGVGVYASKEYNHSKNINNPHQLIGLAAVGITLIQLGFGLTHHLLFTKTQRPSIFGKIHLYMGPLVLIAGTVNGFLGFNFSGGSFHNLMYGIIVAVVFIGLAGALFWAQKKKNRKRRRVEDRRLQDEAYEAFKHQGGYMGVREEGDDDEHEHGGGHGGGHGGERGHMLGEMPREPPPEYAGRGIQGRDIV
ncbi:iron reductase domain protein [Lophiostoma macrostomum CBS 122681]|uniref:Iron reductase domain protein n=1 Tax=Lophiostoma macrostomum CBS 122681 TaxID=1314788 RepID=A0A6A6TS95_9PLEO|nr:iron reductase domain protein [Lophiostoma macrostomum CBS 122681]